MCKFVNMPYLEGKVAEGLFASTSSFHRSHTASKQCSHSLALHLSAALKMKLVVMVLVQDIPRYKFNACKTCLLVHHLA